MKENIKSIIESKIIVEEYNFEENNLLDENLFPF